MGFGDRFLNPRKAHLFLIKESTKLAYGTFTAAWWIVFIFSE